MYVPVRKLVLLNFVLVTFDELSHGTQVSHLHTNTGNCQRAEGETPTYQLEDLSRPTQNPVPPKNLISATGITTATTTCPFTCTATFTVAATFTT